MRINTLVTIAVELSLAVTTPIPPAPTGRMRRWATPGNEPGASPPEPADAARDSSPALAGAAVAAPATAGMAPSLAAPGTAALPPGAGLANAATALRQGAGLANADPAQAPRTSAGLANANAASPAPVPPPVPLTPAIEEKRLPALLRDQRVMLFHPTLLCLAMHHAGRDRLRLPIEDITGAELMPESQSVRFRFGPGGRAGEVVVNTANLGATLIAYCIGAGIPLPNQASKSLQVTEHGVRLELRLTITSTPFYRPRGSSEW